MRGTPTKLQVLVDGSWLPLRSSRGDTEVVVAEGPSIGDDLQAIADHEMHPVRAQRRGGSIAAERAPATASYQSDRHLRARA